MGRPYLRRPYPFFQVKTRRLGDVPFGVGGYTPDTTKGETYVKHIVRLIERHERRR